MIGKLMILLSVATSAPAQTPPTADSLPAVGSVPAIEFRQSTSPPDSVVAATVQRDNGLPRRAPHPRTLREYSGVFIGFSAVWLAIVAYVLSFSKRSEKLAEDLRVAARSE